jgi:hypothetical protein
MKKKQKPNPEKVLNILNELGGTKHTRPESKLDAEMLAEEQGVRSETEQRHDFQRCDDTGKTCYPSYAKAHEIMRRRQFHGAQRLRVYECPHCHKHHLTSYA